MTERVNLAKSKSEYTRTYENPRGVDFSEINPDGTKFSYLENMYVDYDDGADAVESIPGFRKLYSFEEKINAIHLQDLGENKKFLLVHSGKNLYRFNINDRDTLSDLSPIITLKDVKSHSYAIGDNIFIMDGRSILKIDGEGGVHYVSDSSGSETYVPTIYEDGEKKEDRNLLTDRYVQKYSITNTDKYAFYTKTLTYAINDSVNRCCSVTGVASSHSGEIYIPATTVIDGTVYRVTEIAPSAFWGNSLITAVYGGSNLEYIGKYAFKNCHSLERAVFQNALKYIDYSAFCGSPFLLDLYIGLGFKEFAEGAIIDCPLENIHYSGDSRDAEDIVGLDQFTNVSFVPLSVQNDVRFGFKIYGDVSTVDEVTVGGKVTDFKYDTEHSEIVINHKDRLSTVGAEVIIKGSLTEGRLSQSAITGCTLGTAHDGRIFLSGNPALPGYVFYSREAPGGDMFFSENDYFIDGVNNYPVTTLLSAHATLAVFKSDDDGSGSIFCHSGTNENGKKEYPVTYTHGGITKSCASYVIADDAIFLSEKGICALEKVSGSSYRELCCRSNDVNRKLLSEDIRSISLTEWCGYLVLCAGERFYLADSRGKYSNGKSFEYQWYFLNGIGTRKGSRRVYRYSPFSDGYFQAHPTQTGQVAQGEVMSVSKTYGNVSYYVEDDSGTKYSVYPTDEFSGGDFSPACFALGVGKLLFFGTESGDICIFNNDKRGVAPDYVSEIADFDPAEYAAVMKNKIHPYFYTFDGTAITYALKTASDDCSVPHLAKSTVKHSLILKCKNYAESSFCLDAVTDHEKPKHLGKFSMNRIAFNDISFDGLSFSTSGYSIVAVAESEKNWTEKQLSFYSKDFRKPFGICSFTYRYRIKGKIKYS